jgi:dipeptidyl aminopeptidase/acylaminoacyl peptidase
MRSVAFVLAFVLASGCKNGSAAPLNEPPGAGKAREAAAVRANKRVVSFPSGALTLHGVVYTPNGSGPFPSILWNHGSYADPMVAFDELGAAFVARGWAFFGPFRRGQGLSASAGPYIMDEIDRAGTFGSGAAMVRLLAGDHLDDQVAAYEWLKKQSFVAPASIAVGGNSFGGIETVLGAARLPYCAALDGAGAAQSWAHAPELRELMLGAVPRSRAPIYFFQAENDFDLSPSRTLASALRAAGGTAELKIYPAFGASHGDGHGFAWHGSSIWLGDALAFLERSCR